MLFSEKTKVFVLLSSIIHLFFVLLFAEVTLSFSPPPIRELSLVLLTRGGGQGEIIQIEASWPIPPRAEPTFSAEGVWKDFEVSIKEWTTPGLPELAYLTPSETLIPPLQIAALVNRAKFEPPAEMFSQLPAESKVLPIADFALGPVFPEIFERD